MSIQIIDEPRGFAAALGQKFGEGLSESLPKAAERYQTGRVAEQLEKMGSLPKGSSNLFYRLPSEQASQFLPFVQQQQQRQAGKPTISFKNEAQPQTVQTDIRSPSSLEKQYAPVQQPSKEEFRGVQAYSPYSQNEYERALQLQDVSSPEHAQEANRLSSQYPLQYRTPQEASDALTREAGSFIDKFEKVEQRRSETQGLLQNKVSKKLQTGQVYGDVFGDLLQSFENEASNLVLQKKMTPEQASDVVSNEMLNFAKANAKVKNLSSWALRSSTKEEAERSVNEALKYYRKYGRQKEFADILTKEGMRITPDLAHEIAFPEKSEGIKKDLKSLKTSPVGRFISRIPDSFIDSVAQDIKDKDSILSIAYHVRQKGYDPVDFLNRLSRKRDFEGRQSEEIATQIPSNILPSNIFYQNFVKRVK